MKSSSCLLLRLFLGVLVLSCVPAHVLSQNAVPASEPVDQRLIKQAQNARRKGTVWLRSQQGKDGSWRSNSYASLKRGLGTTALVLVTLSRLPEDENRKMEVKRGTSFLKSQINEQGLINPSGDEATYPLYATSLFLMALPETHTENEVALKKSLSSGLLSFQRLRASGWRGDDSDLGGWGPGAEKFEDASRINPSNISITYHVLASLKKSKCLPLQSRSSALKFIEHCQLQGTDHALAGGFLFTVQPDHLLSKAGWERDKHGEVFGIPYLSATCDGISALLICDVSTTDQRMRSALSVLPQLPQARLPERPLDRSAKYTALDAIYFYEQAAQARVWRELQKQGSTNEFLQKQRRQSLRQLIQHQSSDGHWSNPLPWMMEDDPLVATAFAIQAINDWLTEAGN